MASLTYGEVDPDTGITHYYYGVRPCDQRMAPKEEVITMERTAEQVLARAVGVPFPEVQHAVEAEIQIRDLPVSGRLANILDRLNGGCKAIEVLVGTPEGAKCREEVEAVSRMDNLEQFLEAIEYRVGELLSQIDRLGQRLG